MKICIIASLDFTPQILEVEECLSEQGYTVWVPQTSDMIRRKEISLEDILREKESGSFVQRTMRQDSIRNAYKRIKKADAVLVLNYRKKGIENYIGGNTFLEIGFAHVLGKRIYILNPIPDMGYADEISAMGPEILSGDLDNLYQLLACKEKNL